MYLNIRIYNVLSNIGDALTNTLTIDHRRTSALAYCQMRHTHTKIPTAMLSANVCECLHQYWPLSPSRTLTNVCTSIGGWHTGDDLLLNTGEQHWHTVDPFCWSWHTGEHFLGNIGDDITWNTGIGHWPLAIGILWNTDEDTLLNTGNRYAPALTFDLL